MIDRAAVVAEARSWVGTPFHWQARVKGVGCDCMGLVAGVAEALGRSEGARARWDYKLVPAAELRAGLADIFDEADEPDAGDILLLRVNRKPQHLAIYCGGNRMIHTYARGPQRVIEVPMGNVWRAALDSVWTWR